MLSEITSRDKLSRLVSDFRNDILEGNVNPLQAAAVLKAMEDFVKTLRSDILVKDATLQELERYPEKVVRLNGCTFTKKAVGTEWDYSGCNDLELAALKMKADIADKNYKERQKFLQSLPESGLNSFDEETGEVFHIFRPVKLSKEGYSVTLNGE